MKKIIQGLAFATVMTMATSAYAASALVITGLNLRTGPGTGYPRIAAMPGGSIVDVLGCTRGYRWCRVYWNGYEGWAASNYLAQRSGGGSYDNYAASIGVPIIAGAIIGGIIGSGFNNNYYYPRGYHRNYNQNYPRGYHRNYNQNYRRDHHRNYNQNYQGGYHGHRRRPYPSRPLFPYSSGR